MNIRRLEIIGVAILGAAGALGQNPSLESILKNGVVRGGQQTPPPQVAPGQPAPPPPAQVAAPEGQLSPQGGAGGFKISLPPGWQAQLMQDGAVLARSSGDSLVLVAPLSGGEKQAALDWLRRDSARTIGRYLPGATAVSMYPSRMGRAGALASFDFRTPRGPGKANVLCVFQGGTGTLYAIAAPAASFTQQRTQLVRILSSFSFSGEKVAATGGTTAPAAPQVAFQRFRDPLENAFSIDVPSGWKVDGGMVRKASVDVRPYVRAISPEGVAIQLGDAAIPTFVVPTQTLAWTGFREGQPYSPGYGVTMIVRRYLPGHVFAQGYAAQFARAAGAGQIQVREGGARPDLSQKIQMIGQIQTAAGDVSYSCQRGGVEMAGYTLAATQLTTMPGTEGGLWNVSSLVAYLAPMGQQHQVAAVVDRMLRSFQMNPQWVGAQQQTTAATSQIVTETGNYISKVISDSYWSRQRAQDRVNRNFSDYIRGVVRLHDPETGEELEGTAGKNYYWRVRHTNTIIGSDDPTRPPNIDVAELEQVG